MLFASGLSFHKRHRRQASDSNMRYLFPAIKKTVDSITAKEQTVNTQNVKNPIAYQTLQVIKVELQNTLHCNGHCYVNI